MARHLARIIVYGVQSVGRAFAKAIRQEIEASREAARQRQAINSTSFVITKDDAAYQGMTLQEAQQILNVSNLSNRDEIEKKYQHLFRVNQKSVGGSFYLLSKVYRAKERILSELERRAAKERSNLDKEKTASQL